MNLCDNCAYGTCMCDCEGCGMMRIDCTCSDDTHPSYQEVTPPLRERPSQHEIFKILMQNHYGQVSDES